MSELTAKAAYLKGLADGMKLDADKDCSKLLLGIIDLLNEMTSEFTELSDEVGFIADCIEDFDGELDEIAELLSDCGCGDGCDCGEDNGESFKVACPTCQQNIVLNMENFNDEATCPLCGEEIEFDFDFDFGDDEDSDSGFEE